MASATHPFAQQLTTLQHTRNHLIGILESHSVEQLNKIPEGFNNNLIWNAAHCWVTQILLIQGLGGIGVDLDPEFVAAYRKGGKPTAAVDADGVAQIIEGLKQSQVDLSEVLLTGDFSNYRTYTTSYNVTMTNVAEAVAFNNVHEGMHFGTMLALKKLV